MPSRSSAAWRSAASVRSPRSAGMIDALGLERALQRALELALGIGVVERGAADPDPRAAARRAGADVGRDCAVGAERQPDQARRGCPWRGSGRRSVRDPRSPSACSAVRRPTASLPGSSASAASSVRLAGVVLGRAAAFFVLEPVRAGGHDDLVALLFAQAHNRPARRPCPRAGSLGSRRRGSWPLLLDQLVGGEVGEVVERA